MTPEYIILHHSATKDSETLSWSAIRRYHTEALGWTDIGYHFGVEEVGSGAEILMGRMPTSAGAHCKELAMNYKSIGICVVGNFDLVSPSYSVLLKLDSLVAWLKKNYNIPHDNVFGHRDVGMMVGLDWKSGEYKTCPGKYFPIERYR